jgi:hypothetical protein
MAFSASNLKKQSSSETVIIQIITLLGSTDQRQLPLEVKAAVAELGHSEAKN